MKKYFFIPIILLSIFMISCSSSTDTDSNKPEITIIQPQNNETIADSVYTIQVSATDEKSISSIEINIDYIQVTSTSGKMDLEYEWHTFYWTETTAHQIQIVATNDNLNSTKKNINVTLADEAYTTPDLISPPDSSQQQNPLDFKWSSLPQAIQYQIHISINYTPFLNTAMDTVYSNSFSIYGDGTWKVCAQNDWGMSSKFSEEFHFELQQNSERVSE